MTKRRGVRVIEVSGLLRCKSEKNVLLYRNMSRKELLGEVGEVELGIATKKGSYC